MKSFIPDDVLLFLYQLTKKLPEAFALKMRFVKHSQVANFAAKGPCGMICNIL